MSVGWVEAAAGRLSGGETREAVQILVMTLCHYGRSKMKSRAVLRL
jgi:hypothetical protein